MSSISLLHTPVMSPRPVPKDTMESPVEKRTREVAARAIDSHPTPLRFKHHRKRERVGGESETPPPSSMPSPEPKKQIGAVEHLHFTWTSETVPVSSISTFVWPGGKEESAEGSERIPLVLPPSFSSTVQSDQANGTERTIGRFLILNETPPPEESRNDSVPYVPRMLSITPLPSDIGEEQ